MVTSYFQVLIPIISLVMNTLSQIIALRYIKELGVLKSIILGFLVGLLTTTCLELLIPDKTTFAALITNYIIYACLGYCYFHFINLGETARRIRLLREIYDAPAGLTKEELLKRYNAEEVINTRLGRLLNNGQIVLHGERYYAGNPIMLFISKIIVFMKIITLGKDSEFRE